MSQPLSQIVRSSEITISVQAVLLATSTYWWMS